MDWGIASQVVKHSFMGFWVRASFMEFTGGSTDTKCDWLEIPFSVVR